MDTFGSDLEWLFESDKSGDEHHVDTVLFRGS